MKKFFTLLMAVLWVTFTSYGQIVISEISYNPPESGTDSLEYIEIYNAGNAGVNLKDYKFSKGVDFTFPDTTLGSHKYLLIVKHARAFNAVYKINALEWSPTNPLSTSNTLSNSGEILEIVDVSGNIQMSFKYEKVVPWPTFAEGTDGGGASIEICDLAADPSVGSNWKASLHDFGVELNGKKIFGTPGAANSITECVGQTEDLYPLRTIAQLKGVNAEGKADSSGIRCTIKGVVHGINFRPAGLQFTIIDAQNKGFGVFNTNNNLGYTVKEGDEVQVKGSVSQFRGLSQLTADSLKVLASNKALVTPKILTNLSENDESSYVQIKNVSFADPTQWTGTNTGFSMTMTDGTNNFIVRVANVTDAYALPLPSGDKFNVTGILTQFTANTSPPFADGYQLQPNYYTDFVATSASKDLELDAALSVSPNPVSNVLTISTSAQPEILEVYNTTGQLINKSPFTNTIDFSNFNGGIYIIKVIKGEKSSSVKIVKM